MKRTVCILISLCFVFAFSSCINKKTEQTDIHLSDTTASITPTPSPSPTPSPEQTAGITEQRAEDAAQKLIDVLKCLKGANKRVSDAEFVLSQNTDVASTYERRYVSKNPNDENDTVIVDISLDKDGNLKSLSCQHTKAEFLFEPESVEVASKYFCKQLGVKRNAAICDHISMTHNEAEYVHSEKDGVSLCVDLSSAGLDVVISDYDEAKVAFLKYELMQDHISEVFLPMAQFQKESFRYGEEELKEQLPNEMKKLGFDVNAKEIKPLGGYITRVYRTDDNPREDCYLGEYCFDTGEYMLRMNADTGRLTYISFKNGSMLTGADLDIAAKSFLSYLGRSANGFTRSVKSDNLIGLAIESKTALRETIIVSSDINGNVWIRWINTNWVDSIYA